MQNIFLVPNWFLGYDIILELIFALVTLFVSIFAFKIHGITHQPNIKKFAFGFLLISIGYFIQTLLNSVFFFYIQHLYFSPQHAYLILLTYTIMVYAYSYLMLLGLITLVYMTFNTSNIKIHLLISALSLIVLVFGMDELLLFYTMSALITLFIVLHYRKNYKIKKRVNTLIVLLAFCAMFISYIIFIFSTEHELFYFLGHAVKLIAYSMILSNLVSVLNKGKTSRV